MSKEHVDPRQIDLVDMIKEVEQERAADGVGISKLVRDIHQLNREKGFWDQERNIGALLMLIVSELAEALEADRRERHAELPLIDAEMDRVGFERYIKDTFEDEIADTVIRLLDLCGGLGIDINRHIKLKVEYNRGRERMHGKRY